MLKPIDLAQLKIDPFTLVGQDWTLIAAGDEQKYNMMTASWGELGVLWGKNVSTVFIRPTRYTLEFVERKDYYSLSFFDEKYKPALAYCGSHSGRDVNKEKETGLTPVFDAQAPYFSEAKLVLICRKLYHQKLDPSGFIDKGIDSECYPEKDYHELFVGEIISVLADE